MDKKEIRSSNILFLLKCLLFSYILTGGFLLLLAAVSLQIPAVRENRIHCHYRHLRDCRVFCRVHDGKKNGKQKVPLGACGGTCLFRGDGADIAGCEPRI